MAYQALYRKWRPMTFNDVIGQSHIVNTLKNQIVDGKIAHAYLFTGTRGTGKTSTAKIFSRAVNCHNSTDGNPCNECEMCKSIYDGSNLDVIEIDAASNTGVDNIRDIIEQCRYACASSKYKIYIIDEVHMLSIGAFNALLKTLEEPPSHVIFILATTEIHQVPATILSRCQRFDFSVISIYDIASNLKRILGSEGISASDDALEYVAYLGNGSMRDSLSILDRCIAFKQNDITYDDVVNIVGAIDDSVLFEFADYVAKNDTKSLLYNFDKSISKGKSLDNFAVDLVNVYREMLDYLMLGDGFVCSAKKGELIKNTVCNYTQEKIIRCIYLLTDLIRDVKFVSNKRVLIECTLVKMANPMFDEDISSLLDRISVLEKAVKSGSIVACDNKTELPVTNEFDGFEPPAKQFEQQSYELNENNVSDNDNINTDINVNISDDQSGGYNKIINNWTEIIEEIQNQMHLTLYLNISQAIPKKSENGIVLVFPDRQSKMDFDGSKQGDLLSSIILSVTGIKPVITTGIEGEETYVESKIASDSFDIFSDLAKHSDDFPDNIHFE